MFFGFFIVLFGYCICQYPDTKPCYLLNNEEETCLNSDEACAYCEVTNECVSWDICKNAPMKDSSNSNICGYISYDQPYGAWIYDNSETCHEIKDNRLTAKILFFIFCGFAVTLLLIWFLYKLITLIYQKYKINEYQPML